MEAQTETSHATSHPVMAVHQGGPPENTGQTLAITVDSGAAEVVAPPTFALVYVTRPSTGSKAGAKYRTASGNLVSNQGEKRITATTEEGGARMVMFQTAGVTRPLASARTTTSKGRNLVLGDDDSSILHKATGRNIKLHKKGCDCVMRMKILAPHEAMLANNALVLGELGFTREEERRVRHRAS